MNDRQNIDRLFDDARRSLPMSRLIDPDDLAARLAEAESSGEIVSRADSLALEFERTRRTRRYIRGGVMITTIIGAVLLVTSMLTTGKESADEGAVLSERRGVERVEEIENDRIAFDATTAAEGDGIRTGQADGVAGRSNEERPDEPYNPGVEPLLLLDDLTPEELERIFGITVDEEFVRVELMQRIDVGAMSDRQKQSVLRDGFDISEGTLYLTRQDLIQRGRGERNEPEIRQVFDVRPSDALVAISARNRVGSAMQTSQSLSPTMIDAGWSTGWATRGLSNWMNEAPLLDSSSIPHLILVEIPVVTDNRRERYLVWYAPTPELVAALPERYRTPEFEASVRRSIAEGRRISEAFEKDRDQTQRAPQLFAGLEVFTQGRITSDMSSADRTDIEGIGYVDLGRAEAARVGIVGTDSGLTAVMRSYYPASQAPEAVAYYGYEADRSDLIVGYGITHSGEYDRQTRPQTLRAGTFDPDLPSPVLYTERVKQAEGDRVVYRTFLAADPPIPADDLSGNEALVGLLADLRSLRSRSADGAVDRLVDHLIPIRVSLDDDSEGTNGVFWYLPTPDLLDRLPARYRTAIGAEVEEIFGASSEGGSCERVAGEPTYLGLCRHTSGAIAEMEVFPNPLSSSSATRLRITLDEPRELRVTLHDAGGRYLDELSPSRSYGIGTHNITIPPGTFTAGIHLVAVGTERKEQVVQRVVVQ